MSNQLFIPFKKTWDIDIKSAVYDYLRDQLGTHPDAFRWDISRWKTLRKESVGEVVHADRISPTLSYHAQLLSVLAKLPANIQLEIPYAPAFSPSSLPVKLDNIAFERAAVLFNLAALYSQLGVAEDRLNRDGVKRAIASYQNAAGTLSFLISSAIPKIGIKPTDEEVPWDLSEPFVKSLEWLMLAQAQECAWQKAVADRLKNGLIAKLAASVASLYRSSLETVRNASPYIRDEFNASWLSHIEAKQYHFQAAAQMRKSMDEVEGHRYGIELARLAQAQIDAKKGYDLARRPGVAPAVLNDVKSLVGVVQENHLRAERDNDLIYHHRVPTASALDPIQETCMASIAVPPGLADPNIALGGENMIFGSLLGWGARKAIHIYVDTRTNLIQEKMVDAVKWLDDEADKTLRSLNLPSSLEALEKPIGLPPSLLKKAEEVRTDEGPTRIEISIENVEKLARRDMIILNEAMDILDSEASEDEAARKEELIERPPSLEANQGLVTKCQKYRDILEKAAGSDELVRQKWDQWEMNIRELTWDEARLTESVPSSTASVTDNSSDLSQSHIHARELRGLLESFDDLRRSRTEIVERAKRLAEADDIQPRIMEAAAQFDQWAGMEPAMLDDTTDEEIAKYDKFLRDISESEEKQNDSLTAIRARNELFLKSRKDDPSVKEREHALQSLELAYQKYREITHNLDEGLQFYNDLAGVLTEFKETCKVWSNHRKQEIYDLARSFQSVSLHEARA